MNWIHLIIVVIIIAIILLISDLSGGIGNEDHEKAAQATQKNGMELGAHVPGNAPRQR